MPLVNQSSTRLVYVMGTQKIDHITVTLFSTCMDEGTHLDGLASFLVLLGTSWLVFQSGLQLPNPLKLARSKLANFHSIECIHAITAWNRRHE